MRPVRTVGTAAALALLGLLATVPGTAAAAPTLTPQQQATALRIRVDALTLAAETETERYNAAQTALAAQVSKTLLAKQNLERLQVQTAGEQTTQVNQVRALYMTGGSAGLLSSVLDGGNLDDVAQRMHTVQDVMAGTRTRTATSAAQTRRAAAAQAVLATETTKQTALQKQAAADAAQVRTTLATQRTLLATANARVKAIAARQRAARIRREQQAFAAQLAAAKEAAAQSALTGAVPTGGVPTGAVGSSIPTGTAGAPSPVAAAAIAAARTRLGDPYVWGATGPDSFDCSGLTGWAYRQAGLSLPRTSRQQWFAGPHVQMADLAPGDLLFWATDTSNPASIHHVALYIGNGMMIAAPTTGELVQVQAVYLDGYIGAVRPTG